MVLTSKKVFLAIFSFLSLSLISICAYSQCDGGPVIPTDPDDPTSTANCPLDTWVFVLVALTVAYAIWQMRKQKTLSI